MAEPKKSGNASPIDNGTIKAWEDDPGPPASPNQPIARPVPDLGQAPLAFQFQGHRPAPGAYAPGSSDFRYWAAAEALRRGADFWAAILPSGTTWEVGDQLAVLLDQGEDLNAYYDRQALNFFHATVAGTTVYSGESPDVVCHEMGHAILDSVRPQLWDAASAEAAAFHESFGDMSALLSALQLPSMRQALLIATDGNLYRSSRLSRLAEQLGWAIRQRQPDAVDPDCLRNAVNSLFYRDPLTLPPRAPAAQLSSEPHSLSRVFTAAFLESLAGMLSLVGTPATDTNLVQVCGDAAHLLIDAATSTPIVPDYFSQIGAHMIVADKTRFDGRYGAVLRGAFVHHGVLSLQSAIGLASVAADSPTARSMFEVSHAELPEVALSIGEYGFGARTLKVRAPGQTKRFAVLAAGAGLLAASPPASDQAARAYVEDLLKRGHLEMGRDLEIVGDIRHLHTRRTHDIVKDGDGDLVLRRRLFY